MHTVTKVLVVFAAILCVLLAALTMAYSVNADRIVADWRTQVNARQLAEDSAKAQVAAARIELDSKGEQIAKLNNEKTQLSTQKDSLDSERAQLIAQLRSAESGRESNNARIDQLAATNKTQALLIDSYRTEVTKLRDNELAYRKREIELVDRLNDLESTREVQGQNIRALQEQLEEMRRTIDSQGTSYARDSQPTANEPYEPSIAISGKVVATGKSPAGRPIATINVGTNNQVRENMKLVISRGGQFIGNFVVTRADLQWAVGEVNTLGRNVDIREGDAVGTLVSSR